MKRIALLVAALLLAAPAHAQKFQADSNINVTSVMITASNTATVVTDRPATVYGVDATNVTTGAVFVKLYNATSGTCGTGTPVARYGIPASLSGANLAAPNSNGDAYSKGVVMCIVKDITDAGTTSPDSGTGVLNLHWKQLVSP